MNVMKRAWEIAKSGVTKFGGSSKMYFAQALKMAWVELKETKTIVAKILTDDTTKKVNRKNGYSVECCMCGQYAGVHNSIKWSGKWYGKACWRKHVKPLLDAQKLAGEEAWKHNEREMIALIADCETANSSAFVRNIKTQAQKGYLSSKQKEVFFKCLTWSERLQLVSNFANTLTSDNITIAHDNINQMITDALSNDPYPQDATEYTNEQDRAYMQEVYDLYNNNENFKKFLDADKTKNGYDGCAVAAYLLSNRRWFPDQKHELKKLAN